jgi:hypothetical protein
MQDPALSGRASSVPSDLGEIAEGGEFAAITREKKSKTKFIL